MHQFHVHLITEVRLVCDLLLNRLGGRARLPASCLGHARPRCCSAPWPSWPPHRASRPQPPSSLGLWQTGEARLHSCASRSQGQLPSGCRHSPPPRCTTQGVAADWWSGPVEGTSEVVQPNPSISQTGKLRPKKWQGLPWPEGNTARVSIWVFRFFVLGSRCTGHRPY